MAEHPQYRMWKDRLDHERVNEQARNARRTARQAEYARWEEAWLSYKARLTSTVVAMRRPKWWNLPGWVLWLTRLHAPGRRG
jgi:hypothetical protein